MSGCRFANIVMLSTMLAGCAFASASHDVIHEGPVGGVYLERVPDANYQATQPIKIDAPTLAKVFAGLRIDETPTAIQGLFSEQRTEPVFTKDDIAFLAPLISEALERARADQRVRFRIMHAVGPLWKPPGGGAAVGSSAVPPSTAGYNRETTEGTVYVHGLSLHVTLNEYRHRALPPDTIKGPNRYYPSVTGLDDRPLRFSPASAVRPENYKQPWDSANHTVVVDYRSINQPTVAGPSATPSPRPSYSAPPTPTLQKPTDGDHQPDVPVPPPAAAKPSRKAAPSSEELQNLKDLVIKKDLEVEALRKEVKTLKRQIDERDAQIDALRKRIRPTTKSPDYEPAP